MVLPLLNIKVPTYTIIILIFRIKCIWFVPPKMTNDKFSRIICLNENKASSKFVLFYIRFFYYLYADPFIIFFFILLN